MRHARKCFVVAALSCAAAGFPVQAQQAPLQSGELLENGGDQRVKVLQCRATSYRWRECETVLWEGGKAASNPAWWNEDDLIKGDARVRQALGKPPRSGSTLRRTAPDAAPAAQVRTQAAPARAAAGGRVPNGTYKCMTWMGSSYVSMGTVRATNGSLETGLLAKVGAKFTGATPTPEGVTISYTTARGYRESMDCKRQ